MPLFLLTYPVRVRVSVLAVGRSASYLLCTLLKVLLAFEDDLQQVGEFLKVTFTVIAKKF